MTAEIINLSDVRKLCDQDDDAFRALADKSAALRQEVERLRQRLLIADVLLETRRFAAAEIDDMLRRLKWVDLTINEVLRGAG